MRWNKETVAKYLQCPQCAASLILEEKAISCSGPCSLPQGGETRWPLVAGIPQFASRDTDVFEARWRRHPKPQATSSFFKVLLPDDAFKDRVVLDVGCGIGRFTAEAAERAPAQMLSVDIAPAAVLNTVEIVPGTLPVQADILQLPIKNGCVDVAFSIGVLHHTPSTELAFKRAAATVKPGGYFVVWVYCPPSSKEIGAAMDLLFDITSACPKDALYAAIEKHAVHVRDLYNNKWGPLQQVLRVSVSPDDEECISDTFDWHGPQYRFSHTNEEVCQWFKECNFEVVAVGDFPVNVLGRKLG